MRRPILAVAASLCILSCGRGAEEAPSVAAPAAAPAGSDGGTVPHGDHNPHHGGLVLMNGDLHFEVVLGRDGAHRVYFSDATRADLPAATASDVVITVTPRNGAPETVAMHIDDAGESWIGQGRPVADGDASARIAYTAFGKPYFIDVPFPR